MQPSHTMGNLVKNLWDHFGEDGFFNGYRLALHHPDHGLLIAEDIEWFVIRRVAFIPATDIEQLSADQPLPSREMVFHVNEHESFYPIQISDTLLDRAGNAPILPSASIVQPSLAVLSDQWAETLEGQQWLTKASKVPSEQAVALTTRKNWQPSGDALRQWLQTISEVETADVSLALLCDACQQVGVAVDH